MNRLLSFQLIPLLCIGIFHFRLNAAVEERDPETLAKEHVVFVESTYVTTTEVNGEYGLVPYRERRPRWGFTAGLEYSSYEPVNYAPNFGPGNYADIYSSPSLPMLELQLAFKRNISSGSFGAELAFGMFNNEHSDPQFVHSTLDLKAFRLGVNYNMDMLGSEPTIVPYVSAGVYSILFRESLLSQAFNGRTQPAPYAIAGVAFSMDWIDRKSARKAFMESGVESSYLLIEGRKFFKSSNENDPDFSNDINWAAGVRVEF